ncbi:tetratricopeptide repeat protein [Streptomyces specialis]|uniref:tetratricopeptide repeat protein n=1 Tax=Streptomyces specialis TaxID=498367 RepID=UPI000AC6CB49|nr:tetratricopeptide repeat protein [Streptomyces specialis]
MDDRQRLRRGYPLTIPDTLLHSPAMRHACAARDFREIFRLVNRRTGSSHADMAAAIGKMTSSRISDVIRGARGIRGQNVIERIADGFGIPGDMLDLPPRPWEVPPTSGDLSGNPAYAGDSGSGGEVDRTKRRSAVALGGLALATPGVAAQILEQAAAEAAEFTRQAEASMLASDTLAHLDLAVAELDRAYSQAPPRRLFDAVLDYRRKVGALLRARHTHRQGRELLASAGRLSQMLAWLAHDLGDARTGLAFADDAFVHSRQAGHGLLCATSMYAAASINLYEHRPADALAAARRGLAEAPIDHPWTVRLHAQAARACAADRDIEGFEATFRAARDTYDRLPSRPPRLFGVDVLRLADYTLTSYPATAYIWLGRPDRAREYAERTLATYRAAPEATRSPSREAIARIDLALAHAQLGDPDDAVALGHQALGSARVVNSVRNRAGDLTGYLARRYPGNAAVDGLRERLAAA